MQAEHSLSFAGPQAQGAPKAGVAEPRRFETWDPRADDRRRVVVLAPDRVEIARSVAGVFMHIAIASKAYNGVALRLKALGDEGFHYEIQLTHRDPDLCVTLHEAIDDHDICAQWRLWAKFLRLPALVEREEGRAQAQEARLGEISVRRSRARRRGKTMTGRRARFLVRRKTGRVDTTHRSPTNQREIFPGWK